LPIAKTLPSPYRYGCSWGGKQIAKHIPRQLELPLLSAAGAAAGAENDALYDAIVAARRLGHTVYRNGSHIIVDDRPLSVPDFVNWIAWRRRQGT
jgi:hypothetical protein